MKSEEATSLKIQFVDGSLAPRYTEETKELILDTAVITTKGMTSGEPLVDLQLHDADGNKYFTALTGNLFINLAVAITASKERD